MRNWCARFWAVVAVLGSVSFVDAQKGAPNAALAERYYEYFQKIFDKEGPDAAERFLRRAQDYAGDSSDLSYELACVEDMRGRPRRQVIAVLNRALVTARWRHRTAAEARLLKARLLYELKDYYGALSELERVGDDTADSAEKERLYLNALLGLRHGRAFRERFGAAMARRPEVDAELIFRYAASLERLSDEDYELIEAALRRLTRSHSSNDRFYLAAPYLSGVEESRRLLGAWYAERPGAVPLDALPALLNLGVIDEDQAIYALFGSASTAPVEARLLRSVYQLLRTAPSRRRFTAELAVFSGVLAEDTNGDGIFESRAEYRDGMITRFIGDEGQERLDTLTLDFTGGDIQRAMAAAVRLPQLSDLEWDAPEYYTIEYDAYPSVRSVSAGAVTYHFIPDVFYFAPLHFEPIIDDYGLSYPKLSGAVLSGAVLAAFANAISRPSAEFPGAVEELRLVDGIIVSSVERLKGRRISETRYRNGRAVSQRVDIDLDGRLETIRYFSQNTMNEREIEYIEVDWTGNGIYERE